MNTQREPRMNLPDLELRVLSGPQAGARCPLPAHGTLLIAVGDAGAEADILLQGDPALLLRLSPGWPLGQGEVLQGSVLLGEQRYSAGSAFDWPARVALQLGSELVLAFGEREATIWALALAAEPAPAPVAEPPIRALLPAPVAAPRRRRPEAWLAGAGALLGLAGLALAFLPQQTPPAPAPADELPALQALLAEPDFAGLTLDRDAQGRPRLQGRIAGLAQRGRLSTRLAAAGLHPQMLVQVDEQLASAVEEMLQMQGVALHANVSGPGDVRLTGPVPDLPAEGLERALAQTRAALPQLRSLTLATDNAAPAVATKGPAGPNPRVPTLPGVGSEPGKRIVVLVSDGLPHLVTADGARYFVGALLPSGHRVTAVQPQALLLERDGQQTRIDF